MLQQSNLLVVRKPGGLHGSVRQEEEGRETNDNSDTSQDDKHDTPASEASAGGDMLEAVRNGTTKDLAQAQAEIPEREARSLLRFCIPLAANEHQRRPNSCLEDTQEDTRDEQRLVVVSSGTASSGNAPEGDIESEPFGSWDDLEEVGY